MIEQFIQKILPSAQEVQEKYKVPASVCIAQAAHETGWGKSVVGNNYFGIKATSQSGSVITTPTTEYINGKTVHINASFAAYDSLEQSSEEYGIFLSSQKRYAPCFTAPDCYAFCSQLQACGYATDPNYSDELIAIIVQFNLRQYDVSTV
jgi:flagellum-specific peptidoglycan hydrolase FlgJ